MPVFIYRAADRRGQTVDGVMEAPDARAVVERLHREAYFPIRVAPHGERTSWLSISIGGSGRISQRDLMAFTRLYINMVRAGEKGGVLELSLRRLAEFLEARAQFRDAITSALAYPIVITTVGAGAIVFLMTFVIPRFATIFADLGQTIPLPTQILLAVSTRVHDYWWVAP